METTLFKGTPVHTYGRLPIVGSPAPRFTLTQSDLTELRSETLTGRRIVLNIFPSLDTAVCATSVHKFNQLAASFDNTLIAASAFRSPEFATEYGVEMVDGPLASLLARAVIVIDETGQIIHAELVPEITHEPDYEAAVNALKRN